MAETRTEVLQQLDAATYGVESTVTDMQSATGTKDKVAEYWIEILLQKARDMKEKNRQRSAQSISEELQGWLAQQPGDKINPLLEVPGKQYGIICIN